MHKDENLLLLRVRIIRAENVNESRLAVARVSISMSREWINRIAE